MLSSSLWVSKYNSIIYRRIIFKDLSSNVKEENGKRKRQENKTFIILYYIDFILALCSRILNCDYTNIL